MSSYHPQIEDPEKHFLGNLLLDQDDSFLHQLPSSAQNSISTSRDEAYHAIPAIAPAPGGAVGGSHGGNAFWPEPPPPYSPPTPLSAISNTWNLAAAPSLHSSRGNVDDSNAVDWDSYLYSSYALERPSVGVSAWPDSEAVPPMNPQATVSYRDVATRGVPSSISLESSRNSSSSTPPKEAIELINEKKTTGKGDVFQQPFHVPSKNKTATAKKIASKGGKIRGGAGGIAASVEAVEPPPIPAHTRFNVLTKLPTKTTNSSASSTTSEKAFSTVSATRVERKHPTGGAQQRSKKTTVVRRDERRVRNNSHGHVAKIVAVLKALALVALGLAQKAVAFVTELLVDVAVKCWTVVRYSTDHTKTRIQCAVHYYRSLWMGYWEKKKKDKAQVDMSQSLTANISLPETSEEAFDRLISVRDRDAYTVLGVMPSSTDEDIRMYYKRQALLVHPDKNFMPGAGEAFQILSKAFEAVGTPDARVKYNSEKVNFGPLHAEISNLYDALRKKVEQWRNEMDCQCGIRHLRARSTLPQQAARYCKECHTRHPAKNLDIWVESRMFGFVWVYYTCVNGVVYDITAWANCKQNALKHVAPDSHSVAYKLNNGSGKEMRQQADRYLKLLSEGLDRASKSLQTHVLTEKEPLQQLERCEDRPRKDKKAPKKK